MGGWSRNKVLDALQDGTAVVKHKDKTKAKKSNVVYFPEQHIRSPLTLPQTLSQKTVTPTAVPLHNIEDNAIVETVTSDIYLSPRAPCINIIYKVTPVRVDTSSGRTQKSTATGTLQREELPVQVGHIIPTFSQ